MSIIDERDIHPDFGRLPFSRGIPRAVHVLAAIGIVAIFIIGAAVVLNAGYGHYWPSNTSMRAPLAK